MQRGRLIDACVDLVLSRACAGCQVLGTTLCPNCWAAMAQQVGLHPMRTPWPVATGARYENLAKAAIIAHKEHGVRSLTAPLGTLLAGAIATLTRGPTLLVTIPPHRRSVQARGADTALLIAQRAARVARAARALSGNHRKCKFILTPASVTGKTFGHGIAPNFCCHRAI